MDCIYKNLPGRSAWSLFVMDHNVRPGIVAAALIHGIDQGWARGDEEDDWREGVSTDDEDAIEVLRCRAAFRYLLGSHVEDEAEATAVVSALAAVPDAWRSRAQLEIECLGWSWPRIRGTQARVWNNSQKQKVQS